MKKLLLITLFFVLSFLPKVNAQNIYQDLGTSNNAVYGGNISIHGIAMKYDSYTMNFKTQTGYRYRYEIFLYSKSYLNGIQENTSIYNAYVFVNGQNVTVVQYPYGINYLISVTGTNIYIWETNDIAPNFSVTWSNSTIQ